MAVITTVIIMATINKRSNRDYVRHLETIEKLLEDGGGGGGTPNAVKYTPQSLTSEQQQQARTNIGSASASALSQKQDTLVSGTNIKTLNNQSLLGSGNITIDDQSAVKYTEAQSLTNAQKATARGNIAAASLSDINNPQYVKAAIRPEASENTVGPIYLIGPDANDEYERYFTQESNGTYSWVALGSTEIHLDGYATDQDISDVNDEISHLEHEVNEKSVTILGVGDFIFPIKPYGHSANDDKIFVDIKAGSTISGEINLTSGAVTAGSQWQVYYFFADNTNFHRSYYLPTLTFSEELTGSNNKDVIAIGFYISGVTSTGVCNVHLEQSNPSLYRQDMATMKGNITSLQAEQTEISDNLVSVDKEVGLYKYSFTGTGYGHSSLLDQFPIDYKANTVLKGIIRKGTGDGGGSTLQVYLFAADGETWLGRADISFGVEFSLSIASDAKYVGFYISPITTPGTFDVELSYNRLSYEIKDLDTRVDSLENGALPVPSYFAENIEDTVKSAREDMSVVGLDGDNLIFITDIHWENNSKNSPSIIRTICGELNIDNVVFGGDAINGQASQETAMAMFSTIAGQLLSARSRNFVAVIGNHDFNGADGGTAFDDGPKVFYSIFNKNMDYLAKHGGPTYYYFDNPSTQTRFIVLDTGASYTVPETQANWLTQVLNNTDVSLRVVIFMHTFLRERAKYQDDTFIGYDYEVASSGQTVEGIVDTAKANGKNIQCVIAGHAHIDYNVQTDGRIPVIGTDCDGRQSLQWPTTVGTINEQAFDVITIDYVNKTIKCRRVGRGKSRIIHYEAIEMAVGGTLDISSDIEIVPTSYSVRDNLDIKYRNAAGGGPSLTYGASIASISNAGVVTAISSGLLTAVAENDECIETFNIKIS